MSHISPTHKLQRAFALVLVLMILALFFWAISTSTATAAEPLTQRGEPVAVVANVTLNGQLRVSGYHFNPGEEISVRISGIATLGSTFATRSGEVEPIDFDLPRGITVGGYVLELWPEGARNPTTADFIVHPAVTLTLDPISGPPGTEVSYSMTNLLPGNVQLTYEGLNLLRATTAPRSGDLEGTFIVPTNRPRPLGEVATVAVTNRQGNHILGSATTEFQSQEPPPVTPYRLTDISTSSESLSPGDAFMLTGKIVPAPSSTARARNMIDLAAVWENADGVLVPLPSSQTSINDEGEFAIRATAPSALRGDPFSARPGAQVGVQLASDRNVSVSPGFNNQIDFPWLKIAPVKDMTNTAFPNEDGAPIPYQNGNLQVWIEPRGVYSTPAASLINLNNATAQLDSAVVQGTLFTESLLEHGQSLKAKFQHCFIFSEQVAIPWWEWVMTPEETVILSSQPINNDITNEIAGLQLQIPAGKRQQVAAEDELVVYVFDVTVDAAKVIDPPFAPNGYGVVNSKGFIENFKQRYFYIPTLDLAFPLVPTEDGLLTSVPNPVEVPMEPLPDSAKFSTALREVVIYGSVEQDAFSYKPWEQEGNVGLLKDFYTLANVPAGENVGGTEKMILELWPSLFSSLGSEDVDELNIEVKWDGQVIATNQGNTDTNPCDSNTDLTKYFQVELLNSAVSPGLHSLTVDITGGKSSNETQILYFFFKNVPSNDTAIQDITNRVWTWRVKGIVLEGDALEPNSAQSTLSGDLKEAGNRTNNVNLDSTIRWRKSISGNWYQPGQKGTMASEALDNDAADQSFGPSIFGKTGTSDSQFQPLIPVGRAPTAPTNGVGSTTTILDTGKINLFKAQYGIPGVATIGITVDLQVTAVAGIKTQSSEVTVFFESSVTLWVGIEADILMGLAGAEFGAVTNVSVLIPTTYKLGGSKVDLDECFKYRMDIYYTVEVLFGAVDVADGSFNVFNGKTKNCPSLARAIAAQRWAPQTDVTPYLKPQIATDGYGHTMAVWKDSDRNIQSSVFDGQNWQTAVPLTTNGKSGDPDIAFYDVNKAVAVWTQNGLTTEPTSDTAIKDVIKHQHLVYAIYDGTSWSTPQDLTVPTTGDGLVSVVGCMATNLDCPETGAVAAAWVHDDAGDVGQRDFRIHSAVFAGSSWTTYQVDAASTGTDTEPTVAYMNGTPIVAWVHDIDQVADTTNDRHLRLRQLDGSGSIVEPTEIPTGVVHPHLTTADNGDIHLVFTVGDPAEGLLSNRRELHYAVSPCNILACSTRQVVAHRAWSVNAVTDDQGRQILAETPVVTIDNDGKPTATFRMMGLDPLSSTNAPLLSESLPLGVLTQSGELAQIELDNLVSPPIYLTNDGAANWQPEAVYDPTIDQIITLAVKGTAPAKSHTARQIAATFASVATPTSLDPSLVSAAVERGPNFAIGEVASDGSYFVDESDTMQLVVDVTNTGLDWDAAQEAVEIAAAWDAPPGTGAEAGFTTISGLLNGDSQQATFEIAAPTEDPTGPHVLYVTINPGGLIAEQSLLDNETAVDVGTIPAPTGLFSNTPPGKSFVKLFWESAVDERVSGYNIYRSTADGPAELVGSTVVAGWTDLDTEAGQRYTYFVTTTTDTLLESAAGDDLTVDVTVVPENPIFLPFVTVPNTSR